VGRSLDVPVAVLAAITFLGGAGTAPGAPAKQEAHAKRKARHAHAATSGASRFEAPTDATASPAYHYGSLAPADCVAELTRRSIPFVAETARGVAAPVRLTGPLHGVEFHANGVAAKDRATTSYDIADCSLVLALDDFSEILHDHDIVEVRHYSIYRAPSASWPEDKVATRHNGAVAIDAARFIKSDGTTLTVLDDFHGAIGDKTCGDGAGPHPATPAATELRAILCEAVSRHLFNVVLTPDFNRPHRNHFHLEVTAGVKWFLVH
jgi:hypothetical protein